MWVATAACCQNKRRVIKKLLLIVGRAPGQPCVWAKPLPVCILIVLHPHCKRKPFYTNARTTTKNIPFYTKYTYVCQKYSGTGVIL